MRTSVLTRSAWVLALLLALTAPANAVGESTAEADALFAAGDFEKAAAAYSSLVKTAPDMAAAWFGLGRSSIRLEDYKGALKAFKKTLALQHRPAFAMFGLARAHAGLGHDDKAIEWLFKMAETGANGQGLARRTPEIAKLADHPRYEEALHALRPCRSPEHRQFDFWLGDWDVKGQAAPPQQPPSHNRISSREGGCVIMEEYDTPNGYTGVSINFYDANRKQWHQTWMDNQGSPIIHSGGMKDGSMVLIDDPDGEVINRTTWTPLDRDRVRQHWEISQDSGKTWSTVFDGLYTRRQPQ